MKKGAKSVGVQRQYSGTAGRVENCQVGVFLGYASRHGRALIDRALYLPEGWAGDAGRRAGAGVPGGVTFVTKPKLGAAMLERALDAGVPCAWVAGDSVYGADRALRRRIEARGGLGYVLAVTSGQRLGARRVDAWAAGVPPEGWQPAERRRGRQGTAALRLGVPALPRRRPGRLGEGAAGPAQAGRAGRAGVPPDPGARGDRRSPTWCGWRGRAGRSRPASRPRRARSGWTSTRSAPGPAGTGTSRSPCSPTPTSPWSARRRSGGPAPLDLATELLPLTVPEVRRLLWRLLWARRPDPGAVLDWSRWRRRHQQRARRCHWQRRTGSHEPRL